MDKRKQFSPADAYARVRLGEERDRQKEFREKFRANLAKDILLTVMRGGNIPLLHSPQGVTSFTTQMVDYALQVTDYFMAKVYDEDDKEEEV